MIVYCVYTCIYTICLFALVIQQSEIPELDRIRFIGWNHPWFFQRAMFSQLAASTPLFASAFVPGLGSPALAPAVEKHVRAYGEISHPQKKSEFWVNPLEFKVKSPICIMSSKSADSGPPSPRIHHDLRLAMTCNDLQSTTRWDLSWSITILSSVQRQPLQW